jgi:hypothetical protein
MDHAGPKFLTAKLDNVYKTKTIDQLLSEIKESK